MCPDCANRRCGGARSAVWPASDIRDSRCEDGLCEGCVYGVEISRLGAARSPPPGSARARLAVLMSHSCRQNRDLSAETEFTLPSVCFLVVGRMLLESDSLRYTSSER